MGGISKVERTTLLQTADYLFSVFLLFWQLDLQFPHIPLITTVLKGEVRLFLSLVLILVPTDRQTDSLWLLSHPLVVDSSIYTPHSHKQGVCFFTFYFYVLFIN